MKLRYWIILGILITAIIARVFLLFTNPISMFADAIIRYIPQTKQILQLNFNFHDFPLFQIILAFWGLFFSGTFLEIMWKVTSFIFFILIMILMPKLFKRFNLNNNERIIVLALFLFSTWSILLSTTIMQEMLLTFLIISLFLLVENYLEKRRIGNLFLTVLTVFLMCLTKASSFILLAGFGLYILIKNGKYMFNRKIKLLSAIFIGFMLGLFWPIKNYLVFGKPFVGTELTPVVLHSLSGYITSFVQTYHYFWEIPLIDKVNLSGTMGILFNIFYIGALAISISFSLLLIFSFFKYCKKNKEFIGLFLPILLFALFYWPFVILWSASDSGRYTFPLWIFSFIFLAKTISEFRKGMRRITHVIIILFCATSLISAVGISIHMNSINMQVIDMSNRLKQENLQEVSLISNTEFAAADLTYYLGNYVKFNMSKNILDPGVKCSGDLIFESKNFYVFKEEKEYRICRR